MALVHDQMIVFNNVLRYRIIYDAEKHGFPMIPLKNDKVIQEVQIGKIGVRPLVAGEIELHA